MNDIMAVRFMLSLPPSCFRENKLKKLQNDWLWNWQPWQPLRSNSFCKFQCFIML